MDVLLGNVSSAMRPGSAIRPDARPATALWQWDYNMASEIPTRQRRESGI